jgi:pyrroline-5-carboxylate reductase
MSRSRERVGIVGAGNMGLALARGLAATWPDALRRVVLSGRDPERTAAAARSVGVRAVRSNPAAVRAVDTVVLAVKPQILPSVCDEIRNDLSAGQTVLSIAAGVPTGSLERRLGSAVGVVRAMPNVAASVRASATAYCLGRSGGPRDGRRAVEILESIGLVVEVDESLMDAVTGLSGTGPLYLFLILEGLADAGVKVGLSRPVATRLAIQTLVGSALLVQTTGEHPAKLRDLVTSPGGTAITALHSLERSGLKAMLMDAVEAATRRSEELGRSGKRSSAGAGENPPAPAESDA